MLKPKLKLIALIMSLIPVLSGCASSPVVTVVEAPKLNPIEMPTLVQETPPKPSGYYQTLILDALESP